MAQRRASRDDSDSSKPIQLQHEWVFYYDQTQGKGLEKDQYESKLKPLGTFGTVQVRSATSSTLWEHVF